MSASSGFLTPDFLIATASLAGEGAREIPWTASSSGECACIIGSCRCCCRAHIFVQLWVLVPAYFLYHCKPIVLEIQMASQAGRTRSSRNVFFFIDGQAELATALCFPTVLRARHADRTPTTSQPLHCSSKFMPGRRQASRNVNLAIAYAQPTPSRRSSSI